MSMEELGALDPRRSLITRGRAWAVRSDAEALDARVFALGTGALFAEAYEDWRAVQGHETVGYASIGGTHCTRPGSGGDGRWAGLGTTACGLRVPAGGSA